MPHLLSQYFFSNDKFILDIAAPELLESKMIFTASLLISNLELARRRVKINYTERNSFDSN